MNLTEAVFCAIFLLPFSLLVVSTVVENTKKLYKK